MVCTREGIDHKAAIVSSEVVVRIPRGCTICAVVETDGDLDPAFRAEIHTTLVESSAQSYRVQLTMTFYRPTTPSGDR